VLVTEDGLMQGNSQKLLWILSIHEEFISPPINRVELLGPEPSDVTYENWCSPWISYSNQKIRTARKLTYFTPLKMIQHALCTKENMTEALVHQLPPAASITLNSSQLRTMRQTQHTKSTRGWNYSVLGVEITSYPVAWLEIKGFT